MRKELTLADAIAIDLSEQLRRQRIEEQRKRLLDDPTFRVSLSQTALLARLKIRSRVFTGDFGGVELIPNPNQKGNFFVTGAQFASLDAIKTQITRPRTRRRRSPIA